MRLILPIAGVGQRLRPFTFSKPKGFLKIGGQRVVDHIINKISVSIPSKTPLAIVYGYKRAQIQKYLDLHYQNKFQIKYVEQIPKGYQGDVPYFGGLGEAILLTKNWFDRNSNLETKNTSEENTLIFLGDMIPVNDYDFIIQNLENEDIDGLIGTMEVAPEKTQYYGIVEKDEQNFIKSMVEKPKKTNSNLAIAGVYAFKATTMNRLYAILEQQYRNFIEKEKKKKRSEFQFTPALQQLVEEGFRLKPATFQEGILDFGRPDALLNGNRVLLDANNTLIEGAISEIIYSVIKNPCSVGNETSIKRSVIGPYVSIGNRCIIENCNLTNVVIGDDCILRNIISSQSIIGDGVKIDSIIKDKIILGDGSSILKEE